MLPRRFELHRPTTLEGVFDLLDRHGEEASVYAGGTELLVALKARVLHYGHLIDLKGLSGLATIRLEDDSLVDRRAGDPSSDRARPPGGCPGPVLCASERRHRQYPRALRRHDRRQSVLCGTARRSAPLAGCTRRTRATSRVRAEYGNAAWTTSFAGRSRPSDGPMK